MIVITEIIVFSIVALIIVRFFILIIKRTKINKELIANIKPTRSLDKKDIEAIQFIEVDSNLSVDILPIIKRNPKRIIHKSIYRFTDCSFRITTYVIGGRNKIILHHFYISINDQIVEVKIPETFIPFLKVNQPYTNKTIEILYNYDHFTLFNIEGVIGYNSLYEKLTTTNGFERQPTKEELDAFMFSTWNSVWGLITPFCLPIILFLMEEGIAFFEIIFKFPILLLLFTLIFLVVTVPFFIAYKKRKNYINSRKLHTVKGILWFDEKKYIYKINDDELKLHRKWKKAVKKNNLPIHNVEISAFLHTYDNLDLKTVKQFQPIAIISSALNLNENILKSTRSWGTAFLYWLGFGSIAWYAPSITPKGNLFINPFDFFKITDNYLFTLVMTLIWWASIISTLYLSYLLAERIKGHYFED